MPQIVKSSRRYAVLWQHETASFSSSVSLPLGLLLALFLLVNDISARKCLGCGQRISRACHSASFLLSHSTFPLICHGFSRNLFESYGKCHDFVATYP
ncbi:hypothetical protein EUGRSUZ_C01918 [Eucalyptus grandis]|uniref:Uncharacterized protein n=2 Tax=Eucalyptus grandis TaxID=71139 RepID=A0ACC3LFC0_EUCGR|nr:hypothetical protein EUGRSUZ_C01918 [Eucalyptus grandis]